MKKVTKAVIPAAGLTVGGSLFTLLLGPDLQALLNAFYG